MTPVLLIVAAVLVVLWIIGRVRRLFGCALHALLIIAVIILIVVFLLNS